MPTSLRNNTNNAFISWLLMLQKQLRRPAFIPESERGRSEVERMSYANFLCTQMHMTNEQMRALKPNMCKYMHSEKSASK